LGLAACGRPSSPSATALFAESQAIARQLPGRDREFVLSEIALAQARAHRYEAASQTLSGMGEYKDSTLGYIERMRVEGGDTRGAIAMVSLASSADARQVQLIFLAETLAQDGDVQTARQLLPQLRGLDLSAIHEDIAVALAHQGNFAAAWKEAAQMPAGTSDFAFGMLAWEAERKGDEGLAQRAWGRVNKAFRRRYFSGVPAGEATPPDPCLTAHREVLDGNPAAAANDQDCPCWMAAQAAVAPDRPALARQVMRMCDDTNPSDISDGYAHLAVAFAQRGDLPAARQFLEAARVPGSFENGEGYIGPSGEDVALAWGQHGDIQAALQWARSRPSGFERALAILGLASALAGARR
jgi:hypothetical protein